MKINRPRRAEIHFRLEQPPLPPLPPQPLRAAAVFSHGSLETTSASPRALLIGSRDEEERVESQNTTPFHSTGERPVRTARYMAILLSFNLFLSVATSYFTPGRVTLDEILSDTAFHTLSSFYIPRYSLFTTGCNSKCLLHDQHIHISKWLFGRVYLTLSLILFCKLVVSENKISNNCCNCVNSSLFYE